MNKIIISFLVFIITSNSFASESLEQIISPITKKHPDKTGLYVLEKGGEALLARAWLADKATKSIDVQYFIWSDDNIGILASEAVLRAAERGVRVRVLVDDLLIGADNEALFALDNHPNIEIKIYNPVHSVGVNVVERFVKMMVDFRGSNQRMHNKMFVVDDKIAITGGRNMSAEYFDFGHKYNYRDRDVLLMGKVVPEVVKIFEEYWNDDLAYTIDNLIYNPYHFEVNWEPDDQWGNPLDIDEASLVSEKELEIVTKKSIKEYYSELHAYAINEENYLPEVRESLHGIEEEVKNIVESSYWLDARFISDRPGKNSTWFNFSLGGGGDTTQALTELVTNAKDIIVIQSPYLVLSDEAWDLFNDALARGVKIRISTNSLSSSDNLPAYSGYSSQVDELLEAGVEVYEYRHDALRRKELVKRYNQYKGKELPVFSLHAKTMVVDNEIVYIGTFNLDPRSENLNTEVGIVARSAELARAVLDEIEIDMSAGNSWNVREEGHNNDTSIIKRTRLMLWKLVPMDSIL